MLSMGNPDQVLKSFLTICQPRQDFTDSVFASNATLNWYNKQFQGSHRIFQYFRFNLWNQYEHIFEKANFCDAIENSQLHRKTQDEPPENILQRAASSDEDDLRCTTPPPTKAYMTAPPPLTQGRTFLPMTDDEMEICQDNSFNTPPKSTNHFLNDFDLCLSLFDSKSHLIPEMENPAKLKLRKRTNSTYQIDDLQSKKYRKSVENTKISNEISPASVATDNRITNNSNDTIDITTKSQYSVLQYIETIGFVRRICSPKHHRSIISVKNVSEINASPLNYDETEKNTKLKLSYRWRLCDGELQFVLIVYERILKRPQIRRNLAVQFDAIARNLFDDLKEKQNDSKKCKDPTFTMQNCLRF